MAAPPGVQKLQTAMEACMDDLQVRYLIPLQKEAFLCSAKCCDKHKDMQALQQCTFDCQKKVEASHRVLYGNLENFQKRFERCLMRCDDAARESLPHSPGKKDITKAQEQQLACMDACGNEYLGKVPKLKTDMSEDMKRLDQGY